MINSNFVILGAVFSFFGSLGYIVATIKGKTRPNRVTWFLWALAPLVAFVAEIKEGVGIQALMTFMVGFGPLLVFLASFVNKKSAWKLKRFDFICGGLSLLGLFSWYLTKNGNFAILFGILADGLAAVPTLIKSYSFPETEKPYPFLAGAANATITLLTIDTWDFAHYGFPLYILLICIILVMLIKFKIGRAIKRIVSPNAT